MKSGVYKHYLLIVLTVISLFNYVDRWALGIVVEDIKADLGLSDTQFGFLTGIAFALFYSVMGIPIARWADRGNRVTIISLTTLLWSAAVALCGLASNFGQLLLVRIGIAVGEAGCVPPAYSLMADYFSRAERPRAAAIYTLGGPLSAVVGFFLAGWLNERVGWRMTFILLGIPGLVLAAVVWITLKEPRRVLPAVAVEYPSLSDVGRTLLANATFRHLLLALSISVFFGYGIVMWQPAFFIRSFGLTSGQVGMWLALTYGLSGLVGAYLGATLPTRYAAYNERRQLKAVAVSIAVAGALTSCVYLSASPYLAFALLGTAQVGQAAVNGPLLATIQTLVPEHMRATAFALLYLVANLIGMGLGPLAAGALSDALRPLVGDESLRYGLLILAPGYFWVAWHAWRASRTVARDLQAVQVDERGSAVERSIASQTGP